MSCSIIHSYQPQPKAKKPCAKLPFTKLAFPVSRRSVQNRSRRSVAPNRKAASCRGSTFARRARLRLSRRVTRVPDTNVTNARIRQKVKDNTKMGDYLEWKRQAFWQAIGTGVYSLFICAFVYFFLYGCLAIGLFLSEHLN